MPRSLQDLQLRPRSLRHSLAKAYQIIEILAASKRNHRVKRIDAIQRTLQLLQLLNIALADKLRKAERADVLTFTIGLSLSNKLVSLIDTLAETAPMACDVCGDRQVNIEVVKPHSR